MRKKELNTLRGKKVEDLKSQSNELKLQIEKTKIDIKVSKEKNLKKVKNLARDLSQILTIIREKELSGETKENKGKEESK